MWRTMITYVCLFVFNYVFHYSWILYIRLFPGFYSLFFPVFYVFHELSVVTFTIISCIVYAPLFRRFYNSSFSSFLVWRSLIGVIGIVVVLLCFTVGINAANRQQTIEGIKWLKCLRILKKRRSEKRHYKSVRYL